MTKYTIKTNIFDVTNDQGIPDRLSINLTIDQTGENVFSGRIRAHFDCAGTCEKVITSIELGGVKDINDYVNKVCDRVFSNDNGYNEDVRKAAKKSINKALETVVSAGTTIGTTAVGTVQKQL